MPEQVKKTLVPSIYFALAVSTLLVFWQVRNFDFVNYDDNLYVYQNPHVLNGLTADGAIWAFATPHVGNWLPLTWISFMFDCQLFGSNPGWMHLVNLLLHLANTLLLFAILKKMTGSLWPSAFVAAAFALHPMHVESVAWITERKDVLSTLFLMLTLAAYVSYVRRRGLVRYLLTVLLFTLGLLAKPMLVTLPFLLLLLDYWPLGRFDSHQTIKASSGQKHQSSPAHDKRRILYRVIIEKIPFFVLSAVSSAITFFVQQSIGAIADINAFPLKSRLANVFLSYATYIGKMFWPQNLAVFYPFDARTIQSWQIVLCALLTIVISVLTIRFGRKQKYLIVGWLWFVVTLIPVVGLIQSGSQAWADRYTYISYIGLFIMIAWGVPELLSKWPYRKIAIGISMVVVLTALGITAGRQANYWNNSSTLFLHALKVTSGNYVAHDCLGDDLREHGKTALAIEQFTKSLQIKPSYADAVNGIGMALYDEGNLKQAIEYFQKALQLKPDSPSAHNNLGFALQKQEKLNEAAAHFTQAVQVDPDFVLARNNLANVLVLQDRLDEALDQFHAILRLEPDSSYAYDGLGIVLQKQGKLDEAIAHFTKAVQITPDNTQSRLNLGIALLKKGSVSQAIEQFNIVLKAEPNSVTAHSNIGYALSQQGKLDEAVAHFAQAVQISPDFAQARNNLANALKLQDKLDEAAAQFRAAVRLKPDWPAPMNDLAWFTATHPELKGRDVNEAISLARRACQLTNYKNPSLMGTLAAAYASAGKFTEAIDTAKTAINLADAANQPQIKNIIQYHLSFYTQGKPYIEPPPKPLPDSNKP
jgi:tetratricopeptide (TPR) repeat protein